MKKILYLILILFISMFLFSCEANDSPSILDSIDYEKIDYEQFDFGSIEEMIIFHQEMESETQDLEVLIDDLYELEVYSFEVVITEDFQDNLFDYLPPELYNYDINWHEVLTKYAIGTSVIFFTGAMSIITNPLSQIGFIFATSFKEAVKEALIGAAMGAAINVAIQSFSTGDYSKQAITKYAIEGSADGFMWGAITGALLGAYKGYTTYDIHNAALQVLKQSGRYTKTNGVFTIKGKEVFIKKQLMGYIDDWGNVIGTGIYKNINLEGQKLFSVNAKNQIGNYNFRAIEKGIKFDKNGILQGAKYYKNPIPVVGGGSEVGTVLDDTGKIISKIVRGKDASGITRDFVMSMDGRVATILSKGGLETIDDWTNLIGSLANQGVKNAKIAVIEGVKSGEITSRKLQDFVRISDDLRNKYSYQTLWEYIKTNGKFPTDFNWIGHHINNLANYPWLADDINNILIVDSMQHKIIHNFDYRNSTYGSLTNLKQILLIN